MAQQERRAAYNPFGPQKVGGVYRSGYWSQNYTVLDITDGWITVEWSDGRTGRHCTAWDKRHDSVISEEAV